MCIEKMNVFGGRTFDEKILVNANHVDSGTEGLYSELHTVQVGNNSDNQKEVRITIHFAKNSLHHKILRIKISDETNPFYMYTVELNDEAYAVLRHKQGLLVDFANFPNEFVSLLEKCRQHTQSKGRFFAIIEDDSSPTNDILGRHHIICKIVETNCLKYLCYVMLMLSPVDVSEVCEDVFQKMKQLKDSLNRGESAHRQSLNRISELSDKLEEKEKEIEELRKQWSEQQKTWGKSLANQISDVRTEYNTSQEMLLKEMEQKEQDLKKSHTLVIKDMKSQMDQLRNENMELTKSKLELENNIRSMKNTVADLERKVEHLKGDIDKMKMIELENTRELEKKDLSVKTLQSRLANTNSRLLEATKRQAELADMLSNSNKKRNELSKLLHEKDETYQKTNRKLQTVCQELMKANSVIKNMHNENSACKNELAQTKKHFKTHTAGLLEQHKEKIRTLQETLDEKNRQLETLQKSSSTTNEMIQQLKKELMSTKCLTQLHEREIMDLKRQPLHDQRSAQNTLNSIKYCETNALNGLRTLATRTDNQGVLSVPVSSTQNGEHIDSNEKDNSGLNHTNNSLYSTSVHREVKQKETVTPEANKKAYKLVPNGITVKNHSKESKVHVPITSYIKPKAKS